MKKGIEFLACAWWQSFERYTSLNRLPLLSSHLLNPIHHIFQLVWMMMPHLVCCIFKHHIFLTGYIIYFKLIKWARPLTKCFLFSAYLINISSAFYYGAATKGSQSFCLLVSFRKISEVTLDVEHNQPPSFYIFVLLRFGIVKKSKGCDVMRENSGRSLTVQVSFFFFFKYFMPYPHFLHTYLKGQSISPYHQVLSPIF